MLAFFAAVLAAAPSPSPATPDTPATAPPQSGASTPSAVLESALPWWERITVTVDDKGQQQGCRYETSLAGAADCDQAMAASIRAGGNNRAGVFSKVTFERRFNPGGKPDAGKMLPGDMLLGRQVMFLTIDAGGAISSCKVVSTSGEVPPDYGCAEARKEQFRVEAGADAGARQAFMTVMAYGHTERLA